VRGELWLGLQRYATDESSGVSMSQTGISMGRSFGLATAISALLIGLIPVVSACSSREAPPEAAPPERGVAQAALGVGCANTLLLDAPPRLSLREIRPPQVWFF
jgi:hypothetical protein